MFPSVSCRESPLFPAAFYLLYYHRISFIVDFNPLYIFLYREDLNLYNLHI